MKLQPEVPLYCDVRCKDRATADCHIPTKLEWARLNIAVGVARILDGGSPLGMPVGVGESLEDRPNVEMAKRRRDNVAIDIAHCVDQHIQFEEFKNITREF